MASSIFLALALFAGLATAFQPRIIGGNTVAIESYPSVVQVESLNQGVIWLHECGGTILNVIYFLSAAHCFTGSQFSVENRRIRAGAADLETGGVIVYISQVFNHPTYGQNGNDGDISVVRLSSALLFSSTINFRNIVAQSPALSAGMPVTKVGWGSYSVNSHDHSPVLRAASVVVTNFAQCVQNYASLTNSPAVTSNMFCAGSSAADACTNDGGGPVFFNDIVVGIISWGNGCLIDGFPGVNTAVGPYSNWIVETVSAN